jgi:hypothetical protein
VLLGKEINKFHKLLSPISNKSQPKGIRRLVPPSRADIMVSLPEEETTRNVKGLTARQEIWKRVYLGGAFTKIQAGYSITGIVHTTNEKAELNESVLKVKEF